MIKEVDFNKLGQYNDLNIVPVFMQYGKECYEFTSNKKQYNDSWQIFQRIFYYKLYLDKKEYLDTLLDKRLLFEELPSNGILIFSKSEGAFRSEQHVEKEHATKFALNAFIAIMKKKYQNLIVLKKVLLDSKFENFKLFVINIDDMKDEKNIAKEILKIKELYNKDKTYKIKKANLVLGHINGVILTDKEKLINYVGKEFDKRTLLGDIILSDKQENTLNEYTKAQIKRYENTSSSIIPEYDQLFALGLIRYAMRNYNTHKGDFWPYFENDFGVKIPTNKQMYICSAFEKIANKYKIDYDNKVPQKIDNITMHSFVADHSANQLFDYLFDFWRIDLSRNIDNLNNAEKGENAFNTLIDAMKSGTQKVTSHTSLLLNFSKTKSIFKSRIKRILRLMDDSFWNDKLINETGNRINHLLNCWMENPSGVFKKEKTYVAKYTTHEKGEIFFHSPVLCVNYEKEELSIILPFQRLIDCDEKDNPMWIIKSKNIETIKLEVAEHYKQDKICFYIEKMSVNIPFSTMLSEFEIELVSNEKVLKKYKILSSNIRFFDDKGKYIDYRTSNIPEGHVTSYSNNSNYPTIIDDKVEPLNSNGLIMKNFELSKGQIVVLDDNTGKQVGQKLAEGLNESYPIKGVIIKQNSIDYSIYSKLPKLLFAAEKDELNGISLVINEKQNKIIEKPITEFKISKDLKKYGYLIDLNDFINSEGLYSLVLSFPKMSVHHNIGNFAFIKDFNYEFINAPYIFKEYATIKLGKGVKIDENSIRDRGTLKSENNEKLFEFNFGDKNSEYYCGLINDKSLALECFIGKDKYKTFFEIPALYWRCAQDEDWNTNQPTNVLLKELKNKYSKIYLSGPFDFSKASIVTFDDDIDIAEEESKIKQVSGKSKYFELEKAYNWFKNNRTQENRILFLEVEDKKIPLLDVICRSSLKDVCLFGDFDNNLLKGEVDIEGNETYTVSIYHNGQAVCEDEQIIDRQFCVESKLESGVYEIYVYEISSECDDGFDIEVVPILINDNSQPIKKKIINLKNLANEKIKLIGYQDINRKYMPYRFREEYYIKNLKPKKYSDFLEEEHKSRVSSISYNEDGDSSYIGRMDSFISYTGNLVTRKKIPLSSFGEIDWPLTKVFIIFKDNMKPESMNILAKNIDEDLYSLAIDKKKMKIIPAKKMKEICQEDKQYKYRCKWICHNEEFFLIEFEE